MSNVTATTSTAAPVVPSAALNAAGNDTINAAPVTQSVNPVDKATATTGKSGDLPAFEAFQAPDEDEAAAVASPPPQPKALDPNMIKQTTSVLSDAIVQGGPVDQTLRSPELQTNILDLFQQFDLRQDAERSLVEDVASKGGKMVRIMPDQLPNTFMRVKGPCTYFELTEQSGQKKYVGVSTAEPYTIFQAAPGAAPIK
ncbi:hypothetical protein PROFUN_09948 [Planoprotostelium fungivorum]|uniref:Uncharacterized protein n=1 Tax=Planoprotostelium fungivorum TaxID=1890364 RepID=A0A2P6NGA5_9EUKA|nr:hypothetical protein PROFUN_09948 [Planoprotostelium fungivorum]